MQLPRSSRSGIQLTFLVFFLNLSLLAHAQGDLLITPTRVVFEGAKQKEELNLVNVGGDTAIYSISFVQYDMKEDGGFEQLAATDTGRMFADPFLKIFPRRVTLAPREPQVIALQLRRKPDMKDGEYRSHIYFRAEKDSKPLSASKAETDTTQLRIELIPIFGLSIPVIIRSGEVAVKARLSDLQFQVVQDTVPVLSFDLNREGNISLFGDFRVEQIVPGGKTYEVGLVKGVGVYTNITRRHITLRLQPAAGVPLTQGRLRLTYFINDATSRNITLAQEEIELK